MSSRRVEDQYERRGLLRTDVDVEDGRPDEDEDDRRLLRDSPRLRGEYDEDEDDPRLPPQGAHRSPRTPHVQLAHGHDGAGYPTIELARSTSLTDSLPTPTNARKLAKSLRKRFPSRHRSRPFQPVPFCVRWAGLLGSSCIMAIGLIGALLWFGVLHRHPPSAAPSSASQLALDSSAIAAAAASANATVAAALADLTATRASFETTLEERQALLKQHEADRLRKQEEFRQALAQFDRDIKRLAEARDTLEQKKRGMDQAGMESTGDGESIDGISTGASTPASSSSASSSSPPLLRHSLNVHMLARLFDKLSLGWPILVGVVGGSISQSPSSYLHEDDRLNYASQVVAWLNTAYPVAQTEEARAKAGLPTSDTRLAHTLHNRAVGGTSSSSASFCWQELFPLDQMPDLLLVDYAVNDAFVQGGSSVHAAGLPLSSADNMDRLTRSVLLTVERRRLEQIAAAAAAAADTRATGDDTIAGAAATAGTTTPPALVPPSAAALSQHLRLSLLGTGLLFVNFVAQRVEGFVSREDAHAAIARRYSIPTVSQRDWLLNEMRDPLLHGNHTFQPEQFLYYARSGRTSVADGIHANAAGHRLMFRLVQRRLDELFSNYIHSKRGTMERQLLAPQLVDSAAMAHAARSGLAKATPTRVTYMDEVSLLASEVREDDALERSRAAILHEARTAASLVGSTSNSSSVAPLVPSASGTTRPGHHLGSSYIRYRLPPILSTPPLPLGPPHHVFNSLATEFTCKQLYFPYAPEDINARPTDEFQLWFGVASNRGFEWSVHPLHTQKKSLAPSPTWLEAESKRVASLPNGAPIDRTNYPSLVLRIPPVRQSALLFYLRSWQELGSARVWLSCETTDASGAIVEEGRTDAVVLEGQWSTPSTQIAVAILWPPKAAFADSIGPAAKQWTPPHPPFAFNRMHIQLQQPKNFAVIGHAQS